MQQLIVTILQQWSLPRLIQAGDMKHANVYFYIDRFPTLLM